MSCTLIYFYFLCKMKNKVGNLLIFITLYYIYIVIINNTVEIKHYLPILRVMHDDIYL